MKTILGKVFSTKTVTLSEAAKFLSNFVSSENGASQAINAYLNRASGSFNELKKLHKELQSSHSDKKRKRHRPEASHVSEAIGENPIWKDEIIREKSKNKSRRHQLDSQYTVEDEEKPTRSVVEFSQEPDDVVKYYAGYEDGSEKQKKKKNNPELETGEREDEGKQATKSDQEQDHGGEDNMGMGKGKKHKREKKGKDSTNNISRTNNNNVGAEHQKGVNKLCNGELVDPQESRSKKKKRNEAGSENKINTEEGKREQRTKRKNEQVEDKSEESNKRRKRRKREGDE
ncbi:hypothetical protein L6164_035514 [Bauhinia variegata]|uniref:Uncharacterized protein n=1 Tax=Bauhinia variegata TaxID=167791 RepID=A0ACB9KE82_BAUVA|nr:hypothetical protein L6164_035514 [Bauhinia variegata]